MTRSMIRRFTNEVVPLLVVIVVGKHLPAGTVLEMAAEANMTTPLKSCSGI
jgi:hypothetical protein